MMMYNYMCKLGVIVLATLRAFICSVDNPLRRLRESSALQMKVKKQIRFINMENELKKLTYKKSLIGHDWVLSCSLRCAHYVNENQRRYVNFAPLLFVNITFKNITHYDIMKNDLKELLKDLSLVIGIFVCFTMIYILSAFIR